ncbi:hypothetical protein [Quadrisphaera setariae]|uniref:Uncharacterized protein n=1 Tax=Quadrisphaera setariae TaxID=2593304 RepID=A0A5C8ZI93_9ACTN|nr:hypothetical protein [Quadrisphaera setariae]TXR57577.1 hypothetical protein FMM08_04995 [Quadrisphaera setariae]
MRLEVGYRYELHTVDEPIHGRVQEYCGRILSSWGAVAWYLDSPIKKINVSLWRTQHTTFDHVSMRRVTECDGFVHVRLFTDREDFPLASDDELIQFLGDQFIDAHEMAEQHLSLEPGTWTSLLRDLQSAGWPATYALAPKQSRNRRWIAEAGGTVEWRGSTVWLQVKDAKSGEVAAEKRYKIGGDWHYLRAAVRKLQWVDGVARLEPLRRLGLMMGRVLEIDMRSK